MSTVFVGQTIRIRLETNQTLTGLTCWIKYKNPNGTAGYFVATIDPSDASKMYYDMSSVDSNIKGYWKFWAYYFNGTTIIGIGEIVRVQFVEEGYMGNI